MTLKSIRAMFNANINTFIKSREKVLKKFLADVIFGISKSKSVNLSEIARALDCEEKTTPKHIHKRIDRNLGNFDLTKIKDSMQTMQAKMIDNSTYIYFDPTETVKPYGKKFEALSRVADGSDKRKIKSGYPLIACAALKQEELIPLDLDMYSYNEEAFESRNTKYLYHIDSIANRCNRKGIFVLDREFDAYSIIRHIGENGIDFIIRMKEQRHYLLADKLSISGPRYEIINKYAQIKTSELFYLKDKKRNRIEAIKFNLKAAKVHLLGGRLDTERNIWLIRAKSKKLTMYLLTNIENISRETLASIFQAYLNRWKVEEYIRFVKQEYKLEQFKVLSLGRIRNLIQIVFMTTVILSRLAELKFKYSKTRAMLIEEAKRTYKLPQKLKFYMYLVADGLSQVLKKITKKVMNLTKRKQNDQMEFDFGKFGGIL